MTRSMWLCTSEHLYTASDFYHFCTIAESRSEINTAIESKLKEKFPDMVDLANNWLIRKEQALGEFLKKVNALLLNLWIGR